jgi:alpha-tubulin suppressor-like RCC1 family protein
MNARASLVLSSLLLAACQPGAAIGTSCARTADCAEPLVCRAGRCRQECTQNRDCPIGTRCLSGASGIGACSLETDDHCASSSSACAAGLVCIADRCVEACITPSDCPSDGECRDATPIGFCYAPPRDPQGHPIDAALPLDAPAIDLGPADAGASDAGASCIGVACGTASGLCAFNAGACAIRASDDVVLCWGYVSNGTIGDGTSATAINQHTHATPLGIASWAPPTPAIDDATGMPLRAMQIACGNGTACALRVDGSVACWGTNALGQAGQPTTMAVVARAVGVVGLPMPARRVATSADVIGSDVSCAELSDGSTWCWGANVEGWVGAGPQPHLVAAWTASPLLGGDHACAIASDGVRCAGNDGEGQIGPGASATPVTTPTLVPLSSATALAAGDLFSCALASGAAQCWGYAVNGSLGRTVASPFDATPAAIAGMPMLEAVFASPGSSLACARAVGGDVLCWGTLTGECWPSRSGDCTTPALVPALHGATAIAAGPTTACAITADGTIACWGANTLYALGHDGPGALAPEPECIAAAGCP